MNKYIDYLDKEMNESKVLYFKQNKDNKNAIDVYLKINDEHFAVIYKDVIDKIMEMKNEI